MRRFLTNARGTCMRILLGTLAVLLTMLFNNGCKESTPDRKRCDSTTAELAMGDGGFSPEGATTRGLLLSTTENYKSSRLFFFDFATGQKTQLMNGESGDPGIFVSRGQTFFVNRTADNSNLRMLSIGPSSFELGKQTAIPGAGTGDPQSIVHIDDKHLLMAFWASSRLGVFDLEACEMVTTFEFPVDLGNNASNIFRPSAFIQTGFMNETQTYVIHQGISADGYSLNGSQQIFEVTWDGAELSLLDHDLEKDLIQGIPLTVSNPTAAFANSDGSVNIVGSCTIFNSSDCVQGIERVDLKNRTSAMTFDLSTFKEKNNGSIVAASEMHYFMQMIVPGTAGDLSDSRKIIAAVNLENNSVTEIYVYPDTSNGCCGLFFENSSKKLIVTDYTPLGGGELFYIDDQNQISDRITIENTPYNGILLPN